MPWRHLVFPCEGNPYISPELVKIPHVALPIEDMTIDTKPASGLLGTSAPASLLGKEVPLVPKLPVPKCGITDPSTNSSPAKV